MRKFFRKLSGCSVTQAKNRLKSVINYDRITLSQDATMEKIRKDMAAILKKYAGEKQNEVEVRVAFSASHCTLTAVVPLE